MFPTAASLCQEEPRVTLNLKPIERVGKNTMPEVCHLLPWSPLFDHEGAELPDTTARVPIVAPYIEYWKVTAATPLAQSVDPSYTSSNTSPDRRGELVSE